MEEKIIEYLRKYKDTLIEKYLKEENIYLFEKYLDEISDIIDVIYFLEDKEKKEGE